MPGQPVGGQFLEVPMAVSARAAQSVNEVHHPPPSISMSHVDEPLRK